VYHVGLHTGDTAGRAVNTVPSESTGPHRPVQPAVINPTRCGVTKTRAGYGIRVLRDLLICNTLRQNRL